MKKELINSLRTYLNHLLVFIVTIGASVTNMFLKDEVGVVFILGCFILLFLLILYLKIATMKHIKINELKEK
ncbi:MAG: hypothetical protein DRG11_06270 [Epsilonproteobacteria bacterium]|nr:MAG: hypothetical protein DRG11_06270 [Campylobacterota bacterium]